MSYMFEMEPEKMTEAETARYEWWIDRVEKELCEPHGISLEKAVEILDSLHKISNLLTPVEAHDFISFYLWKNKANKEPEK